MLDTSKAPVAFDSDEYGNARRGRVHAKYRGPNWGTGIGGVAITIVANKRWT
ncbi:hypothetical protein [Streptomyces sp. NPDC101237]|uniref:hypothetical protein n=1 Tax=Streptomyces sp. NPDC101237 TaxID=3366139 RepID=UPI00381F5239